MKLGVSVEKSSRVWSLACAIFYDKFLISFTVKLITPVVSVTWSFGNYSDLLLKGLHLYQDQDIYIFISVEKPLCCFVESDSKKLN